MTQIAIYRVSCRACNKEFRGLSFVEASAKHHEHVKTCDTIKAIEKVARFAAAGTKILGRKVSFREAGEILVGKKLKKKQGQA